MFNKFLNCSPVFMSSGQKIIQILVRVWQLVRGPARSKLNLSYRWGE